MPVQETGFYPWVRKMPWRSKWQPTPVFLLGEPHGQRSLVGCSPWGRTGLDTTEHAWEQHECPHLPRLDGLVGLFRHPVKSDIWQWALRFSLLPRSGLSYQTDDTKWGRSPTQWPHARLPRAGRLRHSSLWSPCIHPAGVASGAGVGWTLVTEPFFCLRETPRGRWSLPCT